MAKITQVIEWVFNGLKEGTAGVDSLNKQVEDLDKALDNTAKTGGKFGDQLDQVTSAEKAEKIKRITDGLAGGVTTISASLRGLGLESESFNIIEQRLNEFVAAADGAVRLIEGFSKENISFFKNTIEGFKKSALGAKLFSQTTKRALIATGVGALVVLLASLVTSWDTVKNAASSSLAFIKEKAADLLPGLRPIIEGVSGFAEKVGSLKGLFRGVAETAKAFFSSIGKAFSALIKGDFELLKKTISGFGAEAGTAFNEGLEKQAAADAEKVARALTESQIQANKRRINELKAAGRDVSRLQRANLLKELSLLEAGTAEFLDKQSELNALEIERRASANEKKNKAEEELAALNSERAAAQAAEKEAELAADIEREERRGAALFELEQLRIERQINNLEESNELTAAQIEKRAELEADLAQNELDRALSAEGLIKEEILLLEENFINEFLDIQLSKEEALNDLRTQRADNDKKAAEDQAQREAEALQQSINNRRAQLDTEAEINAQRVGLANALIDVVLSTTNEESKIAKFAQKAKKGIALAEIAINLSRELQLNSLNAAANPANAFTFGAAGITQLGIQNALSIARGIAAGAAVIKARKGGRLVGPSHEGGGIRGRGAFSNIEVEGGEYIVNKTATARNLPLLNRINKMQNGGQLPNFDRINAAVSGTNKQTEEVLATLEKLAAREVVVSVEEINRVGGNVAKVKGTATI